MRYFLTVLIILFSANSYSEDQTLNKNMASAVFSGGCYWCTESDFEKKKGVTSAISGFINGHVENPTYKQVTKGGTGHIEAVLVNYDSSIVSFSELVEFFWRTIDPTDPHGQFCDKGESYVSALYYENDQEKQILDQSLLSLNKSKPFPEEIATKIYKRSKFYPAEEYHQDFYKKNPLRYKFYRSGCGRDNRLEQLWGNAAKP